MTSYDIASHPAAGLFPMLEEADLQKLADDIKTNGLLEPIVLFDGQVLDGRNRLAACRLADVEPRFDKLKDEISSPTIYVLSKNLHRRHLSVSQRAVIAAEALPLMHDESKKRQLSGLKNQTHGSSASHDADGRSSEIVAKEVGIHRRTIERASAVLEVECQPIPKRGETRVSQFRGSPISEELV